MNKRFDDMNKRFEDMNTRLDRIEAAQTRLLYWVRLDWEVPHW